MPEVQCRFFTTVNVTAPLVPFAVFTVTLRLPAEALGEIVKVAVICVALTTFTLLTETPPPLTAMVAPEMKFDPVSVIATVVPWLPEVGAIELSTGTGGAGATTVTDADPTAEGVAALDAVTVTLPDGTTDGAV